MGEARETQHHVDVAHEKRCLSAERFGELDRDYETCARMLERLHQALSDWRGTTRTGTGIHEEQAPYGASSSPDWHEAVRIAEQTMREFT